MVEARTARFAWILAPSPHLPGSAETDSAHGLTDFAQHKTHTIYPGLVGSARDNLARLERRGVVSRLLTPLVRRAADRLMTGEELYLDGRVFKRSAKTGEWHERSVPPHMREHGHAHTDPMWAVHALVTALDGASELDKRDVRGAAARGIAVELDLTKLENPAVSPFGVTLASSDTSKRQRQRLRRAPAQVWLDDAGRVTRLNVTGDPAKQPDETLPMTMEFWDFGVPFADPRST